MNLADEVVCVGRDLDVPQVVVLVARAGEFVMAARDKRRDDDEFSVAPLDAQRVAAFRVALDDVRDGHKAAVLRFC